MSEPVSPPPPPAQTSSNRPVIALVLGIIGLVCCPLTGPVAWYIGKQELAAIATGQAPASGQGLARAGMIIGIIATVWLVFVLFWMLLGSGMAVVQGLSGM